MRHFATHAYTGERLKNRHAQIFFPVTPSAKPVEETAMDKALTAAIDALDTRGEAEPEGGEYDEIENAKGIDD